MDRLLDEEYKVYEINGEKYFPESAVKMLIEEAKKLRNKDSAYTHQGIKKSDLAYPDGFPAQALANPSQNWGKSRIAAPEYKEAQVAENLRLRKIVDDLPTKTSVQKEQP